MKPKILYIAHETGFNGASKSLLNIVEEFQDKYDIYVLIRGEGRLSEELKKHKCKIIIRNYYLDCEMKRSGMFGELIWLFKIIRYLICRRTINLLVANNIAKIVKEENIELIHTNSSSTFMGAYISKITKIPHIWHFREFLWEDFRMIPMLGWRYLYNIASKSADKIICVSDAVLNKYKGVIHTDICRIYNGVPGNVCKLEKKKHETFNILQAGIVSKVKGVDISIRAMRILLDQGFDNIHLYLAGKGNLDFCKEDYDIPDVKSHVHVMGYLNNLREIREQKMDIELVCSRSEAFGRVTVEAMQTGLVVIGANTAGTAELVVDNENGLLFECGNAVDLADKIKWAYKNQDHLYKLRKNALITAAKFSIHNCTQQIEKLYTEILV